MALAACIAATPDQVAAGDESPELGSRRPAGRLAEAAIGDEVQSLRWDAGREDRVDPARDLVGALEVVVLDVDHTGRDVATRARDLAAQLATGTARVG